MRKVKKEITSANILEVGIEHNGYQGGDAGHSGFVKISFMNIASTAMYLNGKEVEHFEFEFKGDSERDTLIDSLEFILDELKNNK
jgi:hypothetical protein